MPTVVYNKKDLLGLIRKNLTDEELHNIINQIKPSVEKISSDEITIEHYADRPDLFGIEGLARAIRQYIGLQSFEKFETRDSGLVVEAERVDVRPFIACAVVKGVSLTDDFIKSLISIQEVLHETFGRKRARVAIGIHDYNQISPPIKYVAANPTERIVPLDRSDEMSLREVLTKVEKGKVYGQIISSSKKWPAFVDKKGIFSFPPIINSDRTRVTENTKNLFIDITGINQKIVLQTMNILVTNLAERGARIEHVRINYGKKKIVVPDLSREKIMIDVKKADEWIGLNLKDDEMILVLRKMGYEAKKGGSKLEVFVPPYRTDIMHVVDIYEDIAIGFGYNNLRPELPRLPVKGGRDELEIFSRKVANVAVKTGLQELLTTILTNEKDQFEKMNIEKPEVPEMENPISNEYTILRQWVVPNLMKVLSINQHVSYPQKVFEIGDVVVIDEKLETKTRNVRRLSVVLANSKMGFQDAASVLDNIMKELKIKYSLKESKHDSFIPGRVASIALRKEVIGFIGEINPSVLQNWKLEMPVAAFELDLEKVFSS